MTETVSVGPSDAVVEHRGQDSIIPIGADENTRRVAKTIVDQLGEPNQGLIHLVVRVIGEERSLAILQEVIALEEQGGLMTKKGDRRRTPGGVFFNLVRRSASRPEKKIMFPFTRGNRGGVKKNKKQPNVVMTWDEAISFIQQDKQKTGEAKTVKTTLIGRPANTRDMGDCIIMRMKGKPPGALPKGLPVPPEDSAITWAVFIAAKQWAKVSASIEENEADQLIIEGYPLLKDGNAVLLAQSCKSMLQERAAKMAKAAA